MQTSPMLEQTQSTSLLSDANQQKLVPVMWTEDEKMNLMSCWEGLSAEVLPDCGFFYRYWKSQKLTDKPIVAALGSWRGMIQLLNTDRKKEQKQSHL